MAAKLHGDLSRRERQIMDLVHQLGEASVGDVHKRLTDPPSYSAVRTMLRLLEKKGYLRHRRDGIKYVYRSTETPEKARRSALPKARQGAAPMSRQAKPRRGRRLRHVLGAALFVLAFGASAVYVFRQSFLVGETRIGRGSRSDDLHPSHVACHRQCSPKRVTQQGCARYL